MLFLHGFPESWYSWRKQIRVFSEAGYRAIAPDLRGYGDTDAPKGVEKYTSLHLVGDLIGLLDALQLKEVGANVFRSWFILLCKFGSHRMSLCTCFLAGISRCS